MIRVQNSDLVHEPKLSLKISHSTNIWLAEFDRHQISRPVMVSVVSLIPTGYNFILFLKAHNVILVSSTNISIVAIQVYWVEF